MSRLTKNAPEAPKTEKAVAFLNYDLPNVDGSVTRVGRGFPIYMKYADKGQKMLVKLAEDNGGSIEMLLPVRINLNNAQEVEDMDLSSIAFTVPTKAE